MHWEKQHSRSLKLNILNFWRQRSCNVGVELNSVSLLRELQKAGNWHMAAHSRSVPWFILCLSLKARPSTSVPGLNQWMLCLKWRNSLFSLSPMRKGSKTLSGNIEKRLSQLNLNKMSYSTISRINSSLFEPTVGKTIRAFGGELQRGGKTKTKTKKPKVKKFF